DWIAKLDDFLRLGERDILTHAGSVNHAAALQHAERAFDLYRRRQDKALTAVDRDFDAATRTLQRIANSTRKPAAKKKDTDT
ncbi:MAG: virulence RhuM family protein, partial [Metallibacterium sp.]